MEINGRPRLACITRMSIVEAGEPITITPLRTFPVIRDLVTDLSFNYAKPRQTPSFTPDPSIGLGEFRLQQVDVQRSQGFRKCIECYLCQNVCHVIRDHPENERPFAGPRFLMRIAELEMHPADTADRREIAQDDFGLGYCNITKCCTEVCQENIKITDKRADPDEGARGGPKVRPAGLARIQDQPSPPRPMHAPRSRQSVRNQSPEQMSRRALHRPPAGPRSCFWTAPSIVSRGWRLRAAAGGRRLPPQPRGPSTRP